MLATARRCPGGGGGCAAAAALPRKLKQVCLILATGTHQWHSPGPGRYTHTHHCLPCASPAADADQQQLNEAGAGAGYAIDYQRPVTPQEWDLVHEWQVDVEPQELTRMQALLAAALTVAAVAAAIAITRKRRG